MNQIQKVDAKFDEHQYRFNISLHRATLIKKGLINDEIQRNCSFASTHNKKTSEINPKNKKNCK